MKFGNLASGMLIGALCSSNVMADNAVQPQNLTMSETQTKAIEKVVHDYLVQHPEVLLEASQALQDAQQKKMQTEAKSAILEHSNELLSENLAVAGNPKGNVTLVEFFDYQCGHCIKMKPIVNNLIKKDPNLRVVYREFPIFGKTSEMASRVALAAALQGKYSSAQDILFGMGHKLDQEGVMKAAKSAGLNMARLQADMESQVVNDKLNANRQLAEKMHLMGTPAFIVLATPAGQFKAGSEPIFVPGATSEEALNSMIQKLGGKA